MTSSSGADAQTQNYDPALVSLFAQSVSMLQMASTPYPGIDITLVGRRETCRQTNSLVGKSSPNDRRCRSKQVLK